MAFLFRVKPVIPPAVFAVMITSLLDDLVTGCTGETIAILLLHCPVTRNELSRKCWDAIVTNRSSPSSMVKGSENNEFCHMQKNHGSIERIAAICSFQFDSLVPLMNLRSDSTMSRQDDHRANVGLV